MTDDWWHDDDAWIAALERALLFFSSQTGAEDHDNNDVHRTVDTLNLIITRRKMAQT